MLKKSTIIIIIVIIQLFQKSDEKKLQTSNAADILPNRQSSDSYYLLDKNQMLSQSYYIRCSVGIVYNNIDTISTGTRGDHNGAQSLSFLYFPHKLVYG